MQQIVAKPVVAFSVIESDFELGPRTIEDARPVNILLDQQRNAAGCEKLITTILRFLCRLYGVVKQQCLSKQYV